MGTAADRVQAYFRIKAEQLQAGARLPIAEHAGLAGSHREELQRLYLSEILPRRYGVTRGMVYGVLGRSREADIIIWDSLNYPSLPMLDHTFVFAESARVVIECKSRWSGDEFSDVRKKVASIRSLILSYRPNLDSAVSMLQLDVAALKEGVGHSGMLYVQHRIGTAAIFLSGGANALSNGDLSGVPLDEIDDSWPDALLLLEPGRVILKNQDNEGGAALHFFDLEQDALLLFTNALLRLISERSVLTEGAFFLDPYASVVIDSPPTSEVPFPIHGWAPQRIPLWGS